MNFPILSLLVWIPVLGSLVILFLNRDKEELIKRVALAFTIIPLILAIMLWASFDQGVPGMQFVEQFDWIPSLGISYYFGVDGISMPMVLLTVIISALAALASFGINKRVKEYFVLFLLLETGMMGVFLALDYVFFYVFWELVLVPMYFLIGIWGGPRREYAALKFFIYTLIGSVIMLVGILALYFASGAETFAILGIADRIAEAGMSLRWQWWVFLALFLGFAVKVPVFPFHTWLPDAHVEAPTPISVILAGVLLKMGTYGLVRISMTTLPEALQMFTWPLLILGIINLMYGALVAMAQRDVKRLVAYSSVSHMGFVLIGLAAGSATAINGAIYQMFSHGLISGMLFLMVGVFYDRFHTRDMDTMGGLFVSQPVAATLMAFAAFASLGLPGLSGFIAEFFTLLGAYPVFKAPVIIAVFGIVLTAAYYLLMMRDILMGEGKPEYMEHPDASPREMATLVPLVGLILLFGVMPSLLVNMMNESVLALVSRLGGI